MCSLVLFLHAYIHSLRKGPEPFLPNKDISRSHFSLKEGEAQLQVGQIHVPTVGTKHSSLVYVQRPSFQPLTHYHRKQQTCHQIVGMLKIYQDCFGVRENRSDNYVDDNKIELAKFSILAGISFPSPLPSPLRTMVIYFPFH